MKITLVGEEIELKFTHGRMDNIEKKIGSLYGYSDKCSSKAVTISDIICIYYNAQEGTAYSENQIFEKILVDGLASHVAQSYDVIIRLVFGEKITKQLEEDSKKK